MSETIQAFDAVRIFFTGVGGQGTLLATRMVGEAALAEGLPVTMSEIHGMAQRGGVVESSVVIGKVFSPTIPDGEADILMAFEPLEALRAIPKCHAGSLIIASTAPIVPFTVAVGQSRLGTFSLMPSNWPARPARKGLPTLSWWAFWPGRAACPSLGTVGKRLCRRRFLPGLLRSIGRLLRPAIRLVPKPGDQ